MTDPTDPNLPDVDSPPADEVLEQAPSKVEIIADQPSVEEILGDEFPPPPRSDDP
jgi:hypothetical protein